MPEPSKPQTWVACVLSLFCAGLGHLYVGRLTRGLVLFLGSLVIVPAAALVAGLIPSTATLVALVASFGGLLGLWAFAVVDARRICSRMSELSPREYQQPAVYALFLAAGVVSPVLSTAY